MGKLLDEADRIQVKTKTVLDKINSDINQINDIADATLEELRANSEQITNTINETNSIDKKLDKSEQLKNKFSMLNGRFFNLFSKKNKTNKTKHNITPTTTITTSPTIVPSPNTNDIGNGTTVVNLTNVTNSKFDEIQVGSDNLANRLGKINKTDIEIDNSLDAISNSLDKIMEKAHVMKDEVVNQNKKLDELDLNMSNVVNKQDKINSGLKNILRWKS